MPIGETLLVALAGKALEKTADALNELRKESRADRVSIDTSHSRTCLITHVKSVDAWSAAITLLSLLRDKQLRESFVELSLDVGLVRYEQRTHSRPSVKVDDIAAGVGNVVILGRPGAGKTTSLQRIAQTSLADWQGGRAGVPLLVRLRDLRGDETLVSHLLALVGMDVKVPSRVAPHMRRAWEKRALLQYLDSISAVLLVDGLDEVPFFSRHEVETDLRDIILFPGCHRVIVTCRTAEYTAPLPTSETYTILPLSQGQVREFAERWLGEEASGFVRAVAQNPYAGTEVVPLTLAHLCAIYERDGELPPRPIDVYEQIVSLLVEEWDKQRRIVRPSRYSDFSWRKKERFLQAAAYHLAMQGRKGSFWEDDLRRVYGEIAPEFNLPPDDAQEVVREIESHTGLIHEVGYRQYDFVHLAIQEYLAAMYAHRKANAVPRLVPNYPNEMALVIAYSTSAEEHLEQALSEMLRHFADGSGVFVVPFLSRLAVERPVWRPTPRLGWTILTFFDQVSRHFRKLDGHRRLRLPPEVLLLSKEPAIAESIRYAAAEADRYEEMFAYRLIPKPHANLPPALASFLRDRSEAGITLLKSERQFRRLLKEKRKPPTDRTPRLR